MSIAASDTIQEKNPAWVDPSEYPFAPHFKETRAGRIHYIDEGQGECIVFVHGTPTWSFLYRKLIKGLSAHYRCIAVDHLGFGLSDKPADGPYRPEDHARNLTELITTLGLREITLVVHDFGGPIGLSYALENPSNVKRIVLFNTWMWSLAEEPQARSVDRLVRGSLGDFLYRRLNVSPRFLLPQIFADRSRLTPAIHRHYLQPFPTRESRTALLALARNLVGSSSWYETLWNKRGNLRDIPALLLWGKKDPTFGPKARERWQTVFAKSETIDFADAGHFVPEEASAGEITEHIYQFLKGNSKEQ
jgi:pimeloyl-ACP methyl ester carboxylesterase